MGGDLVKASFEIDFDSFDCSISLFDSNNDICLLLFLILNALTTSPEHLCDQHLFFKPHQLVFPSI